MHDTLACLADTLPRHVSLQSCVDAGQACSVRGRCQVLTLVPRLSLAGAAAGTSLAGRAFIRLIGRSGCRERGYLGPQTCAAGVTSLALKSAGGGPFTTFVLEQAQPGTYTIRVRSQHGDGSRSFAEQECGWVDHEHQKPRFVLRPKA